MRTKRTNSIFLVFAVFFTLAAVLILGKLWRFVRSPGQAISLVENFVPPMSTSDQTGSQLFLPLVTADYTFAADNQDPVASFQDNQWMQFGELHLLDGDVSFQFTISCDERISVAIPPINIIAWYPEVFEDQEFGIGKNSAVAWEHLGYEGLWIHSGWDFLLERSPATDLQYFLETDTINEVQSLEVIEKKLNKCLKGSQVSLDQGGITYSGQVVAAVRVPAVGVEELSKHTMDLVPYLAGAYPQSGFADLSPDAMLVYFCGRAALDERTDPDTGYWTQTRFIIALEPNE